MKHSDLPWEFRLLTGRDVRGMGYLEDSHGNDLASLGDSALWEEENKANAAFIVKACNNHESLLATLKKAYRKGLFHQLEDRGFREEVREAIKEAEK